MPNDLRTSESDLIGDDYTARLLRAFDLHRAAERSEQAHASRAAHMPHVPYGTPAPMRSPYLRLRQDLRDAQEGRRRTARAPQTGISTSPRIPAPEGRHLPSKRRWWRQVQRPFQQLSTHLTAVLVLGFCCAGGSVFAYTVYAAGVRARPATVTYVDAPLSDVIAELRRRSGLDIRLCNVAPGRDRVTLTLADTPIDTVLHRIGRQNKLLVHWWWNPRTVLLQPRIEINPEHGLQYNLKIYLLSFTTLGCRP